jgi:hypothetical protein
MNWSRRLECGGGCPHRLFMRIQEQWLRKSKRSAVMIPVPVEVERSLKNVMERDSKGSAGLHKGQDGLYLRFGLFFC